MISEGPSSLCCYLKDTSRDFKSLMSMGNRIFTGRPIVNIPQNLLKKVCEFRKIRNNAKSRDQRLLFDTLKIHKMLGVSVVVFESILKVLKVKTFCLGLD